MCPYVYSIIFFVEYLVSIWFSPRKALLNARLLSEDPCCPRLATPLHHHIVGQSLLQLTRLVWLIRIQRHSRDSGDTMCGQVTKPAAVFERSETNKCGNRLKSAGGTKGLHSSGLPCHCAERSSSTCNEE